MTETFTTRLNLRKWGDGAVDGPARTEFNSMWDDLEARVAMYGQGTLAARPAAAAAQQGKFYSVVGDATALNNGRVWYCDGSTWILVGQNTFNQVVRTEDAAQTPLTVRARTGQTANIQEWYDESGALKSRIDSAGAVYADGFRSLGSAIFQRSTDNTPISVIAKSGGGMTASLQEWVSSSFTTLAAIGPTGISSFDRSASSLAATQGNAFGGAGENGVRLTTWVGTNSTVGIRIRQATSQTADSLQIWNTSNTQIFSIAADGAVTGKQFNASGVGKLVYIKKGANESLSSSTTHQDDDHFFFTAEANAVYEVEMWLDVITSNGFRSSWSLPSGTTYHFSAIDSVTNGAPDAMVNQNDGSLWFTTSTGSVGAIRASFLFIVGGTGGTIQLRWAQGTSSATNTTVGSVSTMRIRRVN